MSSQPTPEDLKKRIDNLNEHDRQTLDRWLSVREEYRSGKLNDCFVIMPFSKTKAGRDKVYWTKFFGEFLEPALRLKGFQVRRSVGNPSMIIKDIINDLAWTELVIAVLTDWNVNVWYELGVRHSLRSGATVMICQEDQIKKLPFDIRAHGVVSYTKDLNQSKFLEKLTDQIKALRPTLKDSPVSEFAHSGATYCVHRALGALRKLKTILPVLGEKAAEERIRLLNEEWREIDVQVTVVKNDIIYMHRGEYPTQGPAAVAFQDSVSGRRLYAEMKSAGDGLRLGSIAGHEGRLTAFAFSFMGELNWFLVVEAHIKQAAL